jgi:alginate O-acetyltransferase complex protein AlgJ
MQRVFFLLLKDLGVKGMSGLDNWLFYKPGVQYLINKSIISDENPDAKYVQRNEKKTHSELVFRTIRRFHDQLHGRGIELLVVPIPGKASIYPGQLSRRMRGKSHTFNSPTCALIDMLKQNGIKAVNLFEIYQSVRNNNAHSQKLYLARDTHWTPAGAKIAADAVAKKIKTYSWFNHEKSRSFTIKKNIVFRNSDILDMMQISGLTSAFPSEEVCCEQIKDTKTGLLMPAMANAPGTYMDPMQSSEILVLGDSYCRIYQIPEPRSLGHIAQHTEKPKEMKTNKKLLLPGSAGFISYLAYQLGTSVDFIVSDGGASTDVRKKLSLNAEILENKKLVIWEFTERDIQLGKAGWHDIPLPIKL